MILEYSLRARTDLFSIRDHIASDDPAAAERVVVRILRSIEHLRQLPEMGRPWRGGATRALSIPGLPYRAHYQIEDDMIEILTIVHTRRKFPP